GGGKGEGRRMMAVGRGACRGAPPGGVGPELVPPPVVELVDRLHQANISFLDQIEELQAAICVFSCYRDDQAQIRLDHFLLCLVGLALALLHHAGNSSNLADLEPGLAGERVDLRPNAIDALRFPGNHALPAEGGKLRHTDDPVRVKFGAVVVLEEILASDVITRREAY